MRDRSRSSRTQKPSTVCVYVYSAGLLKDSFSKVAKIVIKCSYRKGIHLYSIILKQISTKKQSILAIMNAIWLFRISSLSIEYCISFLLTFGERASVIPKENISIIRYSYLKQCAIQTIVKNLVNKVNFFLEVRDILIKTALDKEKQM